MTVHTIDLKFNGEAEAIASFLADSGDGLILIETGPESTWQTLVEGIENSGYSLAEVKHVFLTHVHFDHAGAAWKLAQLGAKIYVHPIGLPHLQDPEKLWNSAKRIYGDEMDVLWGSMQAISPDCLVPVGDGDYIEIGNLGIRVHYTPGHAIHHNAYQIGNAVFTGDVAGIKIENGPVMPPCPPPDINLEQWKLSLQKLRNLQADDLYLTHFGKQPVSESFFNQLENCLDQWADEVLKYYQQGISAEMAEPVFTQFVRNQLAGFGVSDSLIAVYESANPSWMSVSGLLRYWKLKEQGRI